jgi:hypothetical protein
MTSTTAEARVDLAVRDTLRQHAAISRREQENDVIHLDVAMSAEQQQVLYEKLFVAGGTLRREGVRDVVINGKVHVH